MKALQQALQALRAEAEVMRRRPFASGIDARQQLSILVKAEERLRINSETVRVRPTRLDPERVWGQWQAAGFDSSALDGLGFRTLCCSPETGVRPGLVREMAIEPERLRNSRCLYGVVHVYFSRWRDMAQPEVLERTILGAVSNYGRQNPAVQVWRNNRWLFTEQAADKLAEIIVAEQGSVDVALKRHYVAPDTQLGFRIRSQAATRATERFRRSEGHNDAEWALRYLRWMTEEVLSDITLRVPFFSAVSSLILSKSAANSDAFRQSLRGYIQGNGRLGDPRLLETAPNWQAMEVEARQLYLSWLARDNIIFFFNTILPDNNENRRRKDFWLRYHRKIRDFQMAVSENDAWKIRSNKHASQMLYSRVNQSTASAFLMEFECRGKSYVVVEFSEVGYASNIYATTDFEARGVNLRTPCFELSKHLRTSDRIARILHQGTWERSASYLLATELGLNP